MKKLLAPILLGLIGLGGGLVAGQMTRPAPPMDEAANETAQEVDVASTANVGAEVPSGVAEPEGMDKAPDDVASAREDFQAETAALTKRVMKELEEPQVPAVEEVGLTYHKLDKQFVIPVVADERVQSLMVISIELRIDEGASDAVFEHEPKLRDEFLQQLFIHGQSDGFSTIYQKPHVLAYLRDSLLMAAQRVLGDLVHEVLLTSLVRKDV